MQVRRGSQRVRKGSMANTNTKATDEAQIRSPSKPELRWSAQKMLKAPPASSRGKLRCSTSLSRSDISGSNVLKKRAATWFSSFDGPIGFEIRDLTIVTANDIAFSYSLTTLVLRQQTEQNSTCGGAQLATARFAASGSLRMSTTRFRSTLQPARHRSVFSLRQKAWRQFGPSQL